MLTTANNGALAKSENVFAVRLLTQRQDFGVQRPGTRTMYTRYEGY